MSQPTHIHIKPCVLDHYKQLCATHGTAPTAAQIDEIRLAAGTFKCRKTSSLFEPALLYFLPRSAVVFEEDTLLLGWSYQPDGTKQEIWYKLNDSGNTNLSSLSSQRGAPQGYQVKSADSICDAWHPSLAAICAPVIRNNRYMRYAYFTATVRLMRTDTSPASVEDFTRAGSRLHTTFRRAVASGSLSQNLIGATTSRYRLKREHDTVDERTEERMILDPNEALDRAEQPIADDTRRTRLQRSGVIGSERLPQSSHDNDPDRKRKRARRAVVVDLTDSDSSNDIRDEGEAAMARLSCQESVMPAEQELKNMLQNKKVSEIKDILAKRSGQLPDWIEDIVKQEMERKMSRDLAMIRKFF